MKKPKFRDDELVEAVQSCSIDVEGVTYDFNSKSKPVRASHPAVKSNPDLFQAIDPKPEGQ